MVDKTRLRQIGGGGRQDKIRIIVMAVLFVLVLGAFIYLRLGQSETPTDYWETTQEALDPIPSARRLPGATIDPGRLAAVRDDRIETRVQRDPQAYAHLMNESRKLVAGDMDLLGITTADHETLLAQPDAWRGKPVRVKGVLESIWSYGDPEQPEYRGLLSDADQHRYFFTVVEAPQVIEGDVVRLDGFFFKLFAYQNEKQETLDRLPYIIGKTMVRSFLPLPPVTEIDPDLLAGVHDQSLREMDSLEQEALWHLISYSLNADPEAFAAQTIEVRHRDLMDRADELRGVPVRITGTFQLDWPALLGPNGENPLDLPKVWHGLLWQGGRRLIYLIAPEPFPDWAKKGDHVWIHGLFLKRYAWESKREGVVSGPLVVVEKITPWKRPSQVWSPALVWGAVGLGLFVVAGFLVSIFADRRATRDFRQVYIERQRRRLERSGLIGEHAATERQGQTAGVADGGTTSPVPPAGESDPGPGTGPGDSPK